MNLGSNITLLSAAEIKREREVEWLENLWPQCQAVDSCLMEPSPLHLRQGRTSG